MTPLSVFTQTFPLACAAAISGLEAVGAVALVVVLGAAMFPDEAGAGSAAGAGEVAPLLALGAGVAAVGAVLAGAALASAAFVFLLLFLAVAGVAVSAGAVFEALS